ncbi:MAG: hypothetical protein ABIH17_04660 [Pseudomonadota bacterium]
MLLASHRGLLARHRITMIRLTRLARRLEITESPNFVLAELGGEFAVACTDAGREFLDVDPMDDSKGAWVIPLNAAGMVVLLVSLLREEVEAFLTRPAGTVAILVVDAECNPAVAILGVERFTLELARA